MGYPELETSAFLKARRAALDPAELGLPGARARRRVGGLRREEVAQLAGMSVDYYTRIEQGRANAISDAIVDAIARALRLTPDEHTYLRNITQRRRPRPAAGSRPPRPAARPRVRPQIRQVLDALDATIPAFVYGPALDVLAWNRLGNRVSFDLDTLPEDRRNGALMFFLHPDAKALHPDWETVARETVATLRAEAGRTPESPRLCEVVGELRERSEYFCDLWEAQAVSERVNGTKRILNPLVGELVLTYEVFALPADPGLVLCTYTAEQGSRTAEALRELAAGEPVGAVPATVA
ncbi:helix-turn-helix transcriptional regulator [Streptomyces sp. B1866]|uniref:helix-turn-helix domain-containing protein n=1 Tax=Streptomyces sp. B1866 TaxID=3075431 RepID=UPI00288D8B6D|nr:helix-turn-helix transcriptional regulator [Streptomyces sp. B1866]MDT3396798.1 helix-turn-helix transcriptional regulator [Streptomyces sp. B1866]